MPTFIITSPDGREFEVDGPEGSTQEQALAQVQASQGIQAQPAPYQDDGSFVSALPSDQVIDPANFPNISPEGVDELEVGQFGPLGQAAFTGATALTETLGVPGEILKYVANLMPGVNIQEGFATPENLREGLGSLGVPGFTTDTREHFKQQGIPLDQGASPKARAAAGFAGGSGLFTSDQGDTRKQTLEAYGASPVFKDPLSGEEIMFSEGGGMIPVNPPGLDIGDFAASAGPATQIIPEVAGAVGSGILSGGNPAAIAAGAGAGGGLGELLRQFIGSEALGIDQPDPKGEAISAGLTAGITDLIAPGVGNLIRRATSPIPIDKGLSTVAEAINRNTGTFDESLAASQKVGATPTVGQLTGDDDLLALENIVQRDAVTGEPLRQSREASNQALLDEQERINAPFIDETGRTTDDLNLDVEQQLIDPQRQRVQAAEAQREQSVLRAEQEIEDIAGEAIPTIQAGETIRQDILDPELQKLEGVTASKYEALPDERLKRVPVKRTETKTLAEQQIEESKRAISPEIRKEGGEAADVSKRIDTLEKGKEGAEVDTGLLDEFGEPVLKTEGATKPTPQTLSDVNNELSRLRAEKRKIETGLVSSDKSLGTVKRQIGAAEIDRKRAIEIAGDPDLIRALEEAETARRVQGDFERSAVGQVLKRQSGGDYKISDNRVFDDLISGKKAIDKENRDEFFNIIDKPEYGAEKIQVRKGLADIYRKKVASKSGQGRVTAHKNFVEDYGIAIDRLYDGQAAKRIKSTTGQILEEAARVDKTYRETVTKINSEISDKLGIKITNLDNPVNIFSKIKNNRPAVLAFKTNTEKQHPEIWKHFQSLQKDDIASSITSDVKIGDDVIRVPDFAKMNNMLNEPGTDGKSQLAVMDLVFGPQYRKDLITIRDAANVINRGNSLIPAEAKEGGVRKVVSAPLRLIEAYIIRPLSREGRLVTAGKKLGSNKMAQQLADATTDPAKAAKLAELFRLWESQDRTLDLNSPVLRSILISTGLTEGMTGSASTTVEETKPHDHDEHNSHGRPHDKVKY